MRRHHPQQLDAQMYSTAIIDEILEHSEWQNQSSVVQLALKAVADLLQAHAQSLKDIKSVLTTRASKTELTTGLSLKANISDVSKAVEELSSQLELRPTLKDVNNTLREYTTRNQITAILASQEPALSKQPQEDLQMTILKARMDQFQKQLTKKLGGFVSLRQFQEILTILEQKANVAELNQALEGKVSKQYLTTALQKKVSKAEVDNWLSKKADNDDLDYLAKGLEGKVSITTLEKLTSVLQGKANKSDMLLLNNQRSTHQRSQQRMIEDELQGRIQQARSSFALQVKEVRQNLDQELRRMEGGMLNIRREVEGEIRRYSAGMEGELTKKINKQKHEMTEQVESVHQYAKGLQDELKMRSQLFAQLNMTVEKVRKIQESQFGQFDQLNRLIQELSSKSVEKKEFVDWKCNVEAALDRDDIALIQDAFNKFEHQVNAQFRGERAEIETLIGNVRHHFAEQITVLGHEQAEVRKQISRKQDRGTQAEGDLTKKVRRDIEEFRKTLDQLYADTSRKLSISEYEADLLELRKRFEIIGKELKEKANITDVCVLCDSKPNIQDVNNALREINEALAERATEQDLQSIVKDQAVINQTLCSENIVGRWLWQTGQTRSGGLLLWQHETSNTVPDHFFWEKGKSSVLIITAGVYEITACVFGPGCIVSVLANGQPLNQLKNEQNVPMMANRGKRRRQKKEGSSHVVQFSLLPARSRVSVSCMGEASEGFLNIRRL